MADVERGEAAEVFSAVGEAVIGDGAGHAVRVEMVAAGITVASSMRSTGVGEAGMIVASAGGEPALSSAGIARGAQAVLLVRHAT